MKKMYMKKKLSIGLVSVGVVALAGTFLFGSSEEVKEEKVRNAMVYSVADGQGFSGKKFSVLTRALQEANLSFEVSGKVKKVYVNVGQKVKKGDLLVALENRDFLNSYNVAKAEMNKSKSLYERMQKAIRVNAVSRQEFDNAKAGYDAAKANFDIKRKSLSDTNLYSPFNGVVSERFVENFENVNAKTNILRVVDISKILVDFDVSENIIESSNRDKNNYDLKVMLDNFEGKEFGASIYEIGIEPDKNTRTYTVSLELNSIKDVNILPGMTGYVVGSKKVNNDTDNLQDRIPNSALFVDAALEKNYVWVVQNENVSEGAEVSIVKQEVKVVAYDKKFVIVNGIDNDDFIISKGVNLLSDGMVVKVKFSR